MKLRDKKAKGFFIVTDPATGQKWHINPQKYLTPRQKRKMLTRPHLIVQFAHYLEEIMRNKGYDDVEVRANIIASLNGRNPQRLIDPNVDLTAIPYPWWGHADWILPLEVPVTFSRHFNSNLEVRQSWLWVFGIQIVYGLRINEVFAIKNFDQPAYDKKGKLIVHAYNDKVNNPHRLIYLGKETNIGTTIKTGERLARPMIPPKYPNLYFDWDLQNPKLPTNEPKKSSSYKVIQGFHCRAARDCLIHWDAPFTQTHADRHLGNLLGLQAGIPIEIRAQSMGHMVAMNENTYKKRQGIQTQIDVLTQSNKQAIDFTSGLLEAKQIIQKYPNSQVVVVELISKMYQRSESEIEQLLS